MVTKEILGFLGVAPSFIAFVLRGVNWEGFHVQWSQNSGKCGVYGDAYHRTYPLYVYPTQTVSSPRRTQKNMRSRSAFRSLQIIKGSFALAWESLRSLPSHKNNRSMFCCRLMVPTHGHFTRQQKECSRLSSGFQKVCHVLIAWCNGGGQWETTRAVKTRAFAEMAWQRSQRLLWSSQISASYLLGVRFPPRSSPP